MLPRAHGPKILVVRIQLREGGFVEAVHSVTVNWYESMASTMS